MHLSLLFFFFNDTATTEIYTLSLHDALPISSSSASDSDSKVFTTCPVAGFTVAMAISSLPPRDRKSTRLNSSHGYISYAVFCLKKKRQRQSRRGDGTTSCAAIYATTYTSRSA